MTTATLTTTTTATSTKAMSGLASDLAHLSASVDIKHVKYGYYETRPVREDLYSER